MKVMLVNHQSKGVLLRPKSVDLYEFARAPFGTLEQEQGSTCSGLRSANPYDVVAKSSPAGVLVRPSDLALMRNERNEHRHI